MLENKSAKTKPGIGEREKKCMVRRKENDGKYRRQHSLDKVTPDTRAHTSHRLDWPPNSMDSFVCYSL